jgi:hypothetical protein
MQVVVVREFYAVVVEVETCFAMMFGRRLVQPRQSSRVQISNSNLK